MTDLVAEELAADPRVAQARELFHEATQDYRSKITSIRPADPSRKVQYQDWIEALGRARGTPLYYPYLGSGAGNGALVELLDASVKYDMVSGIGVHFWGHSHPTCQATAFDAALGDTIMQGNLQQNREALDVMRGFLDLANQGGASLAHCYLTSNGAMANENAIKLMFQKKQPASRILAFERCFAGRTMTVAQITDNPSYRKGLPKTLEVDYVPFFDPAHSKESTERAVRVLKEHLNRSPDAHAGMILELIQGEGGFRVGDRDFFIPILEELRKREIFVLIDEVQTFGRTTHPFAFQHFELDEYVDAVSVGKSTQVCATLYRAELKPEPGLISQTFTGSTSAILAARALLKELKEGDYFGAEGRNERIHRQFVGRLQAMEHDHPNWVCGPYGCGSMIAFQPFDGTNETVRLFLDALFEAGVIAFPAGASPRRVRFLPPAGAVTEADIDGACNIVEVTLNKVAAKLEIE